MSCKGKIVYSKEGKKIIDCEICGFKHVFPFPKSDLINNIYKEEYYSKEKPNYLKEYTEDLEWWRTIYKARLEKLRNNCEETNLELKILDIGSGPGRFVECAKDLGWDAIGIEPNTIAWKFSTEELGLNIINEFFNVELLNKVNPSVINLGEVIEHLNNPIEILEICYESLPKNGLISIVVPNDFNLLQFFVNEISSNRKNWFIDIPHHINYFNHQSLSNLLKKIGFKIVDLSTTFPLEFFVLTGSDYISNPKLGRSIHLERTKFETKFYKKNPEMIENLYNEFAKIGIGREVYIVGKKL